jgi:hypothetical protein
MPHRFPFPLTRRGQSDKRWRSDRQVDTAGKISSILLIMSVIVPILQWPPRRYQLDDGVVAADQGAKALARMRRSRSILPGLL